MNALIEKYQKEFDDNCRSEFLELRDREEPVKVWEFKQFESMNSYEHQCLMDNASPQLLVHVLRNHMRQTNLGDLGFSVPKNYEEAIMNCSRKLLDLLDENKIANPNGIGIYPPREKPFKKSRVIFVYKDRELEGWYYPNGRMTNLEDQLVDGRMKNWKYVP